MTASAFQLVADLHGHQDRVKTRNRARSISSARNFARASLAPTEATQLHRRVHDPRLAAIAPLSIVGLRRACVSRYGASHGRGRGKKLPHAAATSQSGSLTRHHALQPVGLRPDSF